MKITPILVIKIMKGVRVTLDLRRLLGGKR